MHERQQRAGEGDRRPRVVGDSLVAPYALADLVVGAWLAEPRAELGGDHRFVEVRKRLAPGAHSRLAGELRVGR